MAQAHGDPASVLSVVRADRDGRPELLRLSEGLALRSGERTRYVCPALFASELVPRIAGLADARALVVSSGGAYLLSADGSVEPHPDARLRAGTITALEGNGAVAFALRSVDGGVELLAIDAERAQVLAELPAAFTSLAVDEGGLMAAGREAAGRVLQRGFEPDGGERSAWNGEGVGPLDATGAFARLAHGRPYLLVSAADGLGSELARVDGSGAYRVVQRAGSPISGPVAAGARSWFAFDGRLAELRDGEEVVRREGGPVATCVGRSGPRAYACVGTELLQLAPDGTIGERLFGLDELVPPDLSGLADELAERCNLQWLRFRVDLVGAGVTPNDDGGEPVGERDSGGPRDAGRVRDGGDEAPVGAATGEDSGCAVIEPGIAGGSGASSGIRAGWLGAVLAGICALRTRRRQGRPA